MSGQQALTPLEKPAAEDNPKLKYKDHIGEAQKQWKKALEPGR
jgi:hypothetical protein